MIARVRELVYRAVLDLAGLLDDDVPVFRWLPLSIEEAPCYVIGRPTLAEGDVAALVAVSVPVFVLGRTTRDDDAQIELDALAEHLADGLWRPWHAEGVSLKLTEIEPTVIEIAGTDTPAYTATVVADSAYC